MPAVKYTVLIALCLAALTPRVAAPQTAETPAGAAREGPRSAAPSDPLSPDPPAFYFTLAGSLFYTSRGTEDCPYSCGTVSGVSVGAAFSGGVFIGDNAGVGAEVTIGTGLSGVDTGRIGWSDGTRGHAFDYHPTTVAAFVRAGRNHVRRKDITADGIFGVACDLGNPQGVDLGLVFGVDVVSMVRDRLAVTVGPRVSWYFRGGYEQNRYSDASPAGSLGLSFRVGVRTLR
jgi:hypothetical protein